MVVSFILQGGALSNHCVFTIEEVYRGIPPSSKQNLQHQSENFAVNCKSRQGMQIIAADLGFKDTKRWRPIFCCILRGCDTDSSASAVMEACEGMLYRFFKPSGPYKVDICTHEGNKTSSVSFKSNVCSNSEKILKRLGKVCHKLIAKGKIYSTVLPTEIDAETL
jgi:hypothetical protein